ncbi:MAG: family 20 glycosylhydrolase [Alistipes sp.]|nr:family 20 glycosylhydrolase [Alistipes sp.]
MIDSAVGQQRIDVIPQPGSVTLSEGYFRVDGPVGFAGELPGGYGVFIGDILAREGFQWQATESGETGGIVFLEIPPGGDDNSDEGYRIEVSPNRVVITGHGRAGLLYGLQTFFQLHRNYDGTIPAMVIEDAPRFAYRGVMLDVSRHFFDKDFIIKQLDALARYKLNRLHLLLTEAAGWRLQIDSYPLLTEIAAWRHGAQWKDWNYEYDRRYHAAGQEGAYGGFYTKADIREIVDYASRLNITIIPEIEMPSHSEEVLAVYPELHCSGEPYVGSDFCVGREKTFEFLEDVLLEVLELFPSEYIHIGGDEAGKGAWEKCPECRKRMQQEGLSTVDELQSYMMRRIEKFLLSHGRRVIGWDEIIEGGLSPGATVMSWRGTRGGLEAVRLGRQAVMAPDTYFYFNFYQDAPRDEPVAMGGYIPFEKVNGYDPVAEFLPGDDRSRLRGVQANLRTEYIPDEGLAEYMLYPRIFALSEVAWSDPAAKSYEGFRQLAQRESQYLGNMGYTAFDLAGEKGPRARTIGANLGYGKKVTYAAPYSVHYTAGGGDALFDRQAGDWHYSDGRWQGFLDRGIDLTVDLGEVTPIEKISASFLQDKTNLVWIPSRVKIYTSVDGSIFRELAELSSRTSRDEAALSVEEMVWQGSVDARYIRYIAEAGWESGESWIFCDEIIIE